MFYLGSQFSEMALIVNYKFEEKANPILIDVGANIGGFTRRFAGLGWQVIAFEPVPELVEKFEALNKDFQDQITLFKNAVSDISGQVVPFFTSDVHPGIHTLKPFHETHEAKMEVTTVRLDDILQSQNIPHVTLLKVDIEGADFLALKGFDFKQYRPELIMIEFMDDRSQKNFDYNHHDVAKYMDERGYTTFVAEWEPIKEYYTPDKPIAHRFIQLATYPLDHTPGWGNLIFVPHGDEEKILQAYQVLKRKLAVSFIKTIAKKIPGTQALYSSLRKR